MIGLILQIFIFVLGLFAILKGLKTEDAILMCEGMFLWGSLLFYEIILIKDQIRQTEQRGTKKK